MSTQDDEFAREIESHLELEAEQLRDEGLSADAARAAATKRFGNVVAARERHYEAQRLAWLDRLQQDARGAWRSLRRSPMTSLVAILSLAAGIGATTMTLTVRDIVFRRPPPLYANPGQLSHLQVATPASSIMPVGNAVPSALFARWQEVLGASIAGAVPLGQRTVRTADRREAIAIRSATANLFPVLGVEPMLGVGFDKIPSVAARESSVVLSHRVWEQMFDGRADAIGQTLWIDNHPFIVAGVLPPRFWFSDMGSPIWTVFESSRVPAGNPLALAVVVRRADGETAPALEARVKPALDAYAAQLPATQRPMLVRASSIEGTPIGRQMSLILPYIMGTAVLLTLLIACANVAILLMARWTAREHEIAIRASIGASRVRIIRSLLTESVVIAVCGALLGAGVTVGLNALISYRVGGGAFFDVSVDWRILLQAAAIALGAGVITGILPALNETRRLNRNPLRALAGSDRARQRWRHVLVVAEITMTIALLVVSAAMIDGYFRVMRSDLGFATAPLMTARIENPAGIAIPRITEVLSAIPGVSGASASTSIPMTGSGARVPVSATATSEPFVSERGEIDERFFDTLGVRIVAGRGFMRAEAREGRTAIIDQVLAGRLFPGGDPVGAQVLIDRMPHEIVGVVSSYASNPIRAAFPPPRVFVPLPSADVRRMLFLLRVDANPSELMRRLRDDVERVGDGTSVTSTETMPQILDVMGREMLTGTAPLMPLVTIGVLLTTAGIYGVLAFAIARRSRELAVRVAVGASAGQIVRLVVAHTARLVIIGSACGLFVMVGLARVVRAGGGAGSIWDPPLLAFVLPVALVCVIGAIATWVPSRRALAIDPVVLLREQ